MFTMHGTRKTSITLLTNKCQIDNKNGNEVIEVRKEDKKKENIENRQNSSKKSPIFYSLSLIVLHALDAILLIILLPFIIWQWISANDRLKIVLKAVVEVTLELIMWVIFAGVSVLMTMTFVMEDLYYGKNEQEKLTNQLNTMQNETTLIVNETPNLLKEQDKVKTVEN
ncbi:uncharacterized protein LOC102678352 [Apis dorsata]|uniref:uncharacterized protein LOC102678352 n=1 Tax=Apis dorsata TaxID=7462 RepID=UPI001293D5E0|nr:uncharacterized protein LOC102678352 [Apis dorsata]